MLIYTLSTISLFVHTLQRNGEEEGNILYLDIILFAVDLVIIMSGVVTDIASLVLSEDPL